MSTEQEQYQKEFNRQRAWLINQQVYLQRKVELFKETGTISGEEWEEEEEREEWDNVQYDSANESILEKNVRIFDENRDAYQAGNLAKLKDYVPFEDGYETNFPKAVALYAQKDDGLIPG